MAALLSSAPPALQDVRPVVLKPGTNPVADLTPDGAGAVWMGLFDNGNAHGHATLMVTTTAPGAKTPAMIVPVEGRGDTISDAPFDDENEIATVELVRARLAGRPAVLLVEARRTPAAVLSDPSPTALTVWRLDRNVGVIGPRYSFVRAWAGRAPRPYCSARAALKVELGVPYPDGYDAPDRSDGCAPSSAAQRVAQDTLIAGLDLTSFPNSTGPRRIVGKWSLADYGFTRLRRSSDYVEARTADVGGWEIGFTVLAPGTQAMTICLIDRAQDGGSYRTQTPYRVERQPDGRWRVTGEAMVPPETCRRMPG